jgi:hexosaminidase
MKDITVACPRYTDELGHIDDVPLDPTLSHTYEVIENLLVELTGIFPDNFLHVGGDEVKYGCWNESDAIVSWMAANGFASGDFYGLEQMFFQKIRNVAEEVLSRKLVAWEEVFFNASGGTDGAYSYELISFRCVYGLIMGFLYVTSGSHGAWIGSEALPPDSTIIESWTGSDYLTTARLNGYDGILAYGWYLDRQTPVDGMNTWFYGDSWAQVCVTLSSTGSFCHRLERVVSDVFCGPRDGCRRRLQP